jgi:predicted nucleotide-binding protein
MKPTVFVGSSSERIAIAEAVLVNLAEIAETRSWKHEFRAARPFFSDLMEFKDRVDFAVIVLTPDDLIISRGKQYNVPRDNVIFELGLFLGTLGSDRVFAIVDQNIATKLMSDYSGVNLLTYNPDKAYALASGEINIL